MKSLFEKLMNLRSAVTFEGVKIYHETESSVLVELEDQTIWLPKKYVTLLRRNGSAMVSIPIWLFKKKFPASKYRQFTDT